MVLDSNAIYALREKYGEAFYLLDSEQFRMNFLELKKTFGKIYPNFNIAYSYKTNYIPKLCKIVNELGGYAEVVSDMELELAIRCGVEPKRIIWNGPIKSPMRMKDFLLMGGTVNVDCIEEVECIREIAQSTKNRINIGIRCNYDVKDGVLSRFGLDIHGDDFGKALTIIDETQNIYLINLQCHFAKRNIEYWSERVKGMIELIDRLGVIPERIDLGGGLFGKMDNQLKEQFQQHIPEYKEYAEIVACTFNDYFMESTVKPELIIEPGSALVGDCMKFLATVKTIKNVRGKYIATVLGSQKNISMGNVNPPIEVIHIRDDEKIYKNVDIVGFTCIENDVIYRNYCGALGKGDAIVIGNCGSYSLVMKPPFILPNFPVLDCCDGEAELIKRGENFDDIFRTFVF